MSSKPGHLCQGLAAQITTGLYPEPTAASLLRDPLWMPWAEGAAPPVWAGKSCGPDCPCPGLCGQWLCWCMGGDNRVTQPGTKATYSIFIQSWGASAHNSQGCKRNAGSAQLWNPQRNTEAGSTAPKLSKPSFRLSHNELGCRTQRN